MTNLIPKDLYIYCIKGADEHSDCICVSLKSQPNMFSDIHFKLSYIQSNCLYRHKYITPMKNSGTICGIDFNGVKND